MNENSMDKVRTGALWGGVALGAIGLATFNPILIGLGIAMSGGAHISFITNELAKKEKNGITIANETTICDLDGTIQSNNENHVAGKGKIRRFHDPDKEQKESKPQELLTRLEENKNKNTNPCYEK